ncbi:response regulator [Haliangium ochraceum]|uniref:Putative two component, sigma54 specific, transcriptional regulator, Fis family n=1 Tax=Haliangium ochraceum (strain DSM 14365 / JCM 11303 / SMP-2) TaxID=502025 RepID=D0LIL6_HALO1|nr:response regulator [Haliangium ochraceum]ACY18372.1 putative two component, sigma54 specific, transcriptional regulator, Fis family [Haliangium ochraceum DSM 14365]
MGFEEHRTPPRGFVTALVVDDDESFHDALANVAFASRDYTVMRAYTGGQCIEALEQHHIDIVILDLNLPDGDGFRVLEEIQNNGDDVLVIVLSAYVDRRNHDRARQAGAVQVLGKCYEQYKALPSIIEHHLELRRRQSRTRAAGDFRRLASGSQTPSATPTGAIADASAAAFEGLACSESVSMRRVLHSLRSAAARATPVIVQSEAGGDRALFARYLHACGPHAHTRFATATHANAMSFARALMHEDAGEIDDSERARLLEAAASGTLFIDFADQLDEDTGVRLCAYFAADERPADACFPTLSSPRLVLARVQPRGAELAPWNELVRMSQSGAIELVQVPPLRERRLDIAAEFARHLASSARALGVAAPRSSPEVDARLSRYEFPGNEAELAALATLLCLRHPGAQLEPAQLPLVPTPR